MPSSQVSQISRLLELAMRIGPQSILDVGVGPGRYGFLLRDLFDPLHNKGKWRLRLEGVEVFSEYLNPVHHFCYDKIHIGDMRAILPTLPSKGHDLVLLIDVIEHFPKEEGQRVLLELQRIGYFTIVSTPKQWINQGAVHGNDAETHLSLWRAADFKRVGPCIMVPHTEQLIAIYSQDAERLGHLGRHVRLRAIRDLLPTALHPLMLNFRKRLFR